MWINVEFCGKLSLLAFGGYFKSLNNSLFCHFRVLSYMQISLVQPLFCPTIARTKLAFVQLIFSRQ